MLSIYALITGFCLDLIIGDPKAWWHPVQGIGKLITVLERWLRKPEDRSGKEVWKGRILVLLVLLLTGAATGGILVLTRQISPVLRAAAESIMIWQVLALKSLCKESMLVFEALQKGSVEEARTAVSYIVGRDTDVLDEQGIIRAAVETVAENTCDGVIAPLFWMLLGGPVAGFLYKAVNTMDSMIGYRNERYLWFGRTAARLDDWCNLIPARISAGLMIVAAYLTGMNGRKAAAIYGRDRRKHASPNAGCTEAVIAGALDTALAGDTVYGGVVHKKELIGDANRDIEAEDIRRANRLLYVTGLMAMILVLAIRTAAWLIARG